MNKECGNCMFKRIKQDLIKLACVHDEKEIKDVEPDHTCVNHISAEKFIDSIYKYTEENERRAIK